MFHQVNGSYFRRCVRLFSGVMHRSEEFNLDLWNAQGTLKKFEGQYLKVMKTSGRGSAVKKWWHKSQMGCSLVEGVYEWEGYEICIWFWFELKWLRAKPQITSVLPWSSFALTAAQWMPQNHFLGSRAANTSMLTVLKVQIVLKQWRGLTPLQHPSKFRNRSKLQQFKTEAFFISVNLLFGEN